MDPFVTGLVLGLALNRIDANSTYKRAYAISAKAVERVAEAEMMVEKHQKETNNVFEGLCTRITGISSFMNGPFAELFRPFEHAKDSYLQDLFGSEGLQSLSYVHHVNEYRKLGQLPAHRKQTGPSAAITFLLFGWVGEANRQLDTARKQQQVSRLIVEHSDTVCTMLDLQKDRYQRVDNLLGALNVALLISTGKARQELKKIEWLLDEEGHIPADMTVAQLKSCISAQGVAQMTNSLNIAKVVMSILEEPLFDENAELTQEAQKILTEGEHALKKIQMIEQRGR